MWGGGGGGGYLGMFWVAVLPRSPNLDTVLQRICIHNNINLHKVLSFFSRCGHNQSTLSPEED